MDKNSSFLLGLVAIVSIAAVIAVTRVRRARRRRAADWPEDIMRGLREFDTVRIVAMFGSPESHLATSDPNRLPAIGDEGVVLEWVENPAQGDPQARIIVESADWLAVFRRDELELVTRFQGWANSAPAV